ncbi:transposable element [Pseudoloma neurophilia]|uniref:Transposable element n=1 Tax=Pseudoloma neurophilia TaxID=146866 RepID=A0A0R0M3P2_9MICR|nr:transposable element [Pseudoloma neurophilia]
MPNISHDDVKRVIQECLTCKLNKKRVNKYGKLLGTLDYSKPWDSLAIDLIGPLKREGESKESQILHIMDMGSRLSMTKVLKRADSREISDILEREWFNIYPLPSKILSDNGKVFTSKIYFHSTK